MILIYRCENQQIADYLHEHGIDYDIEGRDRNGASFYGYYKTDEIDYLLKNYE